MPSKKTRRITECPACDAHLDVTELTCVACGTRLAGNFEQPPLARIAGEHQAFIETFLRCRGVIRDVERVLGISYPTVRARLDAAVEALEATLAEETAKRHDLDRETRRKEILKQVAEGKMSAITATEQIKRL
jgi:hypothetical protein